MSICTEAASLSPWADDAHLAELLVLTAQGDEDAFMEFYDQTCTLVWRLESSRHHESRRASIAACARYVSAHRLAGEHAISGLSARAWLLTVRGADREHLVRARPVRPVTPATTATPGALVEAS